MRDLEGKVALVTGSARGLGRSTAEIFAREGAKVVVVDLRQDEGEETVEAIRKSGGEAIFVKADVSKSADVQAMIGAACDRFGGLDCAVNNAVIASQRTPFAEITEEVWDKTISVNLTGVFLCMKYEIQAMLKRGSGAIVNIGSGNEFGCAPGIANYIAAKHGIYGMTKVAALDYGAQGIRINALGPGVMVTPMMREALEKEPKHMEFLSNLAALKRFADPAEVAEAAVWLCSSKASYVHGHTMVADGGAGL